VNAAVWATSRAAVIKNESAFRHKVMTRINESGANQADLQTLAAWRSAQANARNSELARQYSIRQEEHVSQDLAREQARAEAAFSALEPARQDEIITALSAHLAAKRPATYTVFKKSGLKSKMVRAALGEFLKASVMLSPDPVAA
jgi:ribonuclease D